MHKTIFDDDDGDVIIVMMMLFKVDVEFQRAGFSLFRLKIIFYKSV